MPLPELQSNRSLVTLDELAIWVPTCSTPPFGPPMFASAQVSGALAHPGCRANVFRR
jgi:hypothetical protein